MGTDFTGPADKSLRCPFGPFLMGFGHVVIGGGVPPLPVITDMAGDSFVLVEAFNGSLCNADIDLLFDQIS